MDQHTIEQIKDSIYEHLEHYELKAALTLLKELLPQASDWHFHDRIHETITAYGLLLNSFATNQPDEQRQTWLYQLLDQCYTLTDNLVEKLLMELPTHSGYLSKKRFYLASTPTVTTLLEKYERALQQGDIAQGYQYLKVIFDLFWTWPPIEGELHSRLLSYFTQPYVPELHRLAYVSAITLSIQQRFDLEQLRFLIHLAINETSSIALRAMVGVAIALVQWKSRIACNAVLVSDLAPIEASEVLTERMTTIQLLFIRAKDTERIIKKFNEEILPEMLRMSQKFGENMQAKAERTEEEEENPDWEDFIKGSNLEKKLQEVNEMQTEGADFMMSTFANLKLFPFFETLAHWFLPFDSNHPELQEGAVVSLNAKEHQLLIDFIAHTPGLCDSDKYSFYYSVTFSNEPYKNSMMTHLFAQQQEDEEYSNLTHHTVRVPEEVVLNLYIRDLYRFYLLFKRKSEYVNPFEQPFHLFNQPLLEPLLAKPAILKQIAELYFRKKYYEDALVAFHEIHKQSPSELSVVQKLGFCYQQLQRYQEALPFYHQAELLEPHQKWTLKHMAQCYRALGELQEALDCYKTMMELFPDDLQIAIQLAHNYLFHHDWEQALHYYYHVNFANPDLLVAKRGIAWCSMLLGKLDASRGMYQEILESPAVKTDDYLNRGHLALVEGQPEEALTYYRQAIQAGDQGYEQWRHAFEQDEDDLTRLGVARMTCYLVQEVLWGDIKD